MGASTARRAIEPKEPRRTCPTPGTRSSLLPPRRGAPLLTTWADERRRLQRQPDDRRRPRGPAPRLRRDADRRARCVGSAAGPRRHARRAAPRRLAGHQPHRHRRQLRAALQRAAHPRCAVSVPRGARDRDEGRSDAAAVRGSGRATGARSTCARRASARCATCASSASTSTSCTRPTPTCPTRSPSARSAEMQGDGLIRHIGVSNVSLEQLEEARSIVEVVTVQNRFNLTYRDSADVLEVCERDDLGSSPGFRSLRASWPTPAAGRRDRRRARRHDRPGRARVAARALAGHAADSRHGLDRAPAGEHRRQGARPRRARASAARRRGLARRDRGLGLGSGSRGVSSASFDGHQIFGPISNVSAGTSTERTTNVSSRTPKATTKPISVRKMSGRTPSTENTPASTMPAEVMTRAGHREARAACRRLVPYRRVSSRTRAMRKML